MFMPICCCTLLGAAAMPSVDAGACSCPAVAAATQVPYPFAAFHVEHAAIHGYEDQRTLRGSNHEVVAPEGRIAGSKEASLLPEPVRQHDHGHAMLYPKETESSGLAEVRSTHAVAEGSEEPAVSEWAGPAKG